MRAEPSDDMRPSANRFLYSACNLRNRITGHQITTLTTIRCRGVTGEYDKIHRSTEGWVEKFALQEKAHLLGREHIEVAVGRGLILGQEIEVREVQIHCASCGDETVQLHSHPLET